MFETPLNQRTVTLKMERIKVCDLMLACTVLSISTKENGKGGEKWEAPHDQLKSILDEFDKKQGF